MAGHSSSGLATKAQPELSWRSQKRLGKQHLAGARPAIRRTGLWRTPSAGLWRPTLAHTPSAGLWHTPPAHPATHKGGLPGHLAVPNSDTPPEHPLGRAMAHPSGAPLRPHRRPPRVCGGFQQRHPSGTPHPAHPLGTALLRTISMPGRFCNNHPRPIAHI